MTRTLRFYAYSVILFAFWYLQPDLAFSQCAVTGLNTTYCSDDAAVTLTGSSSFWGTGITGGNTFTPSAAVGTNAVAGITYTESAGTFSPIAGSGTALTLADNAVSGAITLPFTFRFYNTNYTTIRIGSNGVVGFVVTSMNSAANQTLPNATAPNAIIAAAWDDLNPAAGGTIEYFTSGTSPNRVFVVNYTNVPIKATGVPITVQLQLYENGSNIQIHTTSADFSTSTATQGIESPAVTGLTFGQAITGRNNSFWTATNECKVLTLCRVTQNVTVNAAPPLNSTVTPATTTICSGGTAAVTIAATNAAVLYQLRNSVTSAPLSGYFYGNGGNLTITSNALSANTTIRVYAKNGTTGCDSDLTNTVNVTVASQPVANAGTDISACGLASTLGATTPAAGTGAWTVVNGPGSVSIPSPASPTSSVSVTAYGVYTLRWTVSNSPCTASADDVQVTFQPNTSITSPPSAAAVCEGGTTSFSVAANGVGLGYQWQVDTGSGFGNIVSETASTLTLSNVTSAMNGYSYRVIVTGSCGPAVTSGGALLTVNEQPEITSSPINRVICDGDNTSFTVNAGVTTGASYQWQVSTNGGASYAGVTNAGIYSGATSSTLSLTGATLGNNGYLYRVIVSGTCSPAVTSDAGVLTVQQAPVISGQPASQAVCEGSTITFSVAATGIGLTYQWKKGGVDIGGATNASLVLSSVSATDAGSYTVLVKGTCNTTGVLSSAGTLTIYKKPEITSQPTNSIICEGGNTSFTVNAGATTGVTYQWQVSTNGGTGYTDVSNGGIYAGATGATLSLTGAPLVNNGYLYRVVVSGTCVPSVTSNAGSLTVQQLPVITGQPSSQVVCEGSAVTFTISATGTGLTYQWKKGGVDIGGATSASLVLSSVSAADAGSYTVLVKGTCNTTGVLSTAATLTINEEPEITSQPGNSVICEGGNTSFTVNAGVTTGVNYQWQVSSNGGTSYTTISNGGIYAGATGATLSLTGAPLVNNGYLYRVIVGGTCAPSVTSDAGLLTIQQAPVITGQPSSQIACEGSAVTFTVSAVGTGLTYQWRKGGVDIGGATSASLMLSSVSAGDAASYTVLVKGTCNTTGVLSSAGTLTVNEKPEITNQPGNSVICEGGNTSFTVNAGVTTSATYQWQVSINGGTSYTTISNGGIYSGATGATLSLTGAPLVNNGYLYRVVVGGTCAPSVTSDAGLLTIQQAPVITGQPSSQIVCEGSTVTFAVNAVGMGLTYQWKKGGVDIGGATSASFVLSSVSATDAASYTVLVKGTCNTTGVLSSAATLTINEKPEITAQPTNVIICEGGNTNFAVNAGVTTGATYQWQVSTNGGTSYTTVSNTGIYSGATSATLSLTGAPLANNGYLYRVVVGGTCTPGVTSDAGLLTIQQAPVITGQPSNQVVCEGSTVTFSVSAVGTGLTYQWSKGGVDIGGATSASLVLSSVSAADAGSYRVLVKGTCNTTGVLSSAVTLTVNEKPEITSQPGNTIICEGGNTSFTVNAGVTTGATYQWQVSTNGGTGYTNVNNGSLYAGATSATLSLTNAPLANNGYLYRVVVGGTCTPGVTSDGGLLTVQQAPVITGQPSSQVVCEGSTVTFSVSAVGTGLTYQWSKGGVDIGGATSASLVLSSVSAADAGSYRVLVKGTCNTTGVLSSAVTLTVNEQPEITSQPGNTIICEGGNTSFTVNAGVTTGATYQWQVSTNGGTGYSNISNGGIYAGVTGATLSLTGAPLANNGYLYRVVVGGTCTPGVTSDGGLLTVQQAPVITGQPSGQVVCEGSTVTFTVGAVGTGLTYQWKKNAVDISGATSASLVLSSVSAADAASYTVLVKGTCNTTGVLSSAGTLVVNERPEITSQPGNTVICEGGNTSFTVNAGVTTAATYQWQVSTNGGTSFTNISIGGIYSGTTSNTLNLNSVPLGNNGYLYRVVVGGTCGPNVISDGGLLTVQQAPVISGQPASQEFCEGSTVTFTVNAVGTGLTYQWKKNTIDIGGANGPGLTLSSVSATDAASYTVLVKGTCNNTTGVLSSVATLIVDEKPEITSQPGNTVICEGGNTNFTVNAGVTTGATYQWQISTNGGTGYSNVSNGGIYAGATSATLSLTGVPLANNGYLYRVVVGGTCAPGVTSDGALLTVQQAPVITGQPSSPTICEGSAVTLSVTAVGTGLTYQWKKNTIDIGGANGPSLVFSSASTADAASYTVLVKGTCNNTTGVLSSVGTLTVNRIPNALASDVTICSGSTTGIAITNPNGVSGTAFNWTVQSSVNVTGASSGSGNTIAQALTVTDGHTSGLVTYLISPTAAGCTGAAYAVQASVMPVPTVSASPQTICSGESTSVAISNPNAVSGTMFNWSVVNATNVTGASGGSGSTISQVLTSTDGVNAGTVNYRITPVAGGCAGTPVDVTVTVSPKPVITNSPSTLIAEVCSGTTLNFLPTSTLSGTTFSWTSSVIGTLTSVSASGNGVISDKPVNATNTSAVIIYTITPSRGGCTGAAINYVVTVRPVPTAGTSGVTTICSGTQTAISINNPNSVSGTTYTWSVFSPTNVTGASGGSGNAISQVLTSADGVNTGTVIYRITPSSNGCAGAPVDVTMTVNPAPVITNAAGNLTIQICSGTPLSFTPSSSISGTTFTWTSSINGSVSAGSVTANGSGAIVDSPVNTGNTAGTVTYRIIPQFNGCSGQPINYVVTVKPTPTASASNVTICSGQTAVINILPTPMSVSGTTFTWTASASGNVSGAANGNGSTISQVLTTTNALVGTVTYSIIPTASGCNGSVSTVTATVDPIATVNAGADYSVCEPVTIPLSGTLGGSATNGTWSISSGAGTISSSTVSGTTVSAVYTVAVGDIGGSVKFILTTNDPDGGGPCSFVTDDLIVSVNRKARVTVAADYTVCEPGSIPLSGILSGSATSGLWSVMSGGGSLSATSVTGTAVTASYSVSGADVTQTLRFRLTTNDPDGFGPCVAEFSEVNVQINQSAKVNAGPDKAVCEDEQVILNGSFVSPTTSVTWSGGSGAAQFSNVSNPTATYTLTPGDISNGGITLTLSSNDPDGSGPCAVVSDQVFIKVNKLPVVGLSNLKASYAENSPIESLDGFPTGGVFTGPGIIAGTNQFDPGSAPFGSVVITYSYVDPASGCDNTISRSTIVNPVTDIDFDIAPVRRDGSGFPIICANSGNLTLIGYPPFNDPSAKTAFFRSDDIPNRIGFDGTNYIIKTDGLEAGEYEVQYVYENIAEARDTLTKLVTVYSGPKAVISVDRVCQGVPLTFEDASYIPNNTKNGHIIKYYWKYGEFGTGSDSGTPRNPSYTYQTSGLKTVELKVETDQGCMHDTTNIVRVGVKPELSFDWKKICSGIETTEFQDKSVTTEFSKIKEYQWNFGDGYTLSFGAPNANVPTGANDNSTSGTYNNPKHTYSLFKVYNVTLTVNTEENCTTSKTSRVYILDYNIPGPTQGYFTNFENGPGTWVEISNEASDTSWVFGPLDQSPVIKKAASGVNAWWTGSNPNSATDFSTYYKNEASGVIGPCLNLENLKRPMLSLNYWSDMQAGFDGAVIQYSTDGGITWETIGNAEGDGVSWYNSRDLQSSPGGQDNYAWSGSTGEWRNARFNLDQIPASKRDLVVFRIAFASNSDNPTGAILNGFAFDDVYIGEKHRNVLVEEFTNDSSAPSNQADAYFDDLYVKQFTVKDSSDFIMMQYHIATPGPDQLNADNPGDPNARSLLYGVSQPPTAFMDGIQGLYGPTTFNGGYDKINADEIDRRALADPLFDIDIELLSGGEAGRLQGKVTYTYIDSTRSLFSPVVLHAALLETGYNGNTNVVRKLLFGEGGRVYNDGWQRGSEIEIPVDYTLDVPIAYPNALSVVAFVQDKNSQYIHQAVIVKAPSKQGIAPPVGVEDDPQVALLSDLKVYPNPASQAVYFGLDQPLERGYTWKLIDQRGVTVLGGELNRDLKSSPQKVDVSGLANGIYILAIQTGEKALVYRKVAVMNGH